MAATGVQAVMENFDFDLTFNVTEFTVLVVVQSFVTPARSTSARFTEKQKELINSLGKGAPVFIQDIRAVGPDGTVRPLNTISFKIN